MFKPTRIIDIEMSRPVLAIENLAGYGSLKALVRLHGAPIGFIDIPISGNHCPAEILADAIVKKHHEAILRRLVRNGLQQPLPTRELSVQDLLDLPQQLDANPQPLITVAVCTRDRTHNLAQCLDALLKLEYPRLEILVIDNAPSDAATEQLVLNNYPTMRYVKEPIPGLDWARNRAISEAHGEVIAYTDDDVIVDPGWVTAIVRPFMEDPSVMAVTGLVIPLEFETESQVLFERYGGFSRGFRRRWYRVDQRRAYPWEYRGTGQFGTGANMAYRRSLFESMAPFDPALDVGTVTNGGGDLDMFFRVLKEGYTLVYEPEAIVRHRHRLTYPELRAQISNNGIAVYSFFAKAMQSYREERRAFLRLGWWWFWFGIVLRMLMNMWRPESLPRDLIWAELTGALVGLTRYPKALRQARSLARTFGVALPTGSETPPHPSLRSDKERYATAVRTVDVCEPIAAISDVDAYAQTWIVVMRGTQPLGTVTILNAHRPITATHLRDIIADQLFGRLLTVDDTAKELSSPLLSLQRYFFPTSRPAPLVLPQDISVSIVLATLDRPDDLARCLETLHRQDVHRKVEIIVVDNRPASGLTAPVVAQFPGVRLVPESRQGLAYARNAGIRASQGDIIVATDDDVYAPPNWLETLIAPFAHNEVAAVTGNVLPIELETSSQILFEKYGGLGRGFLRKNVGSQWFRASRLQPVPTWELGCTANAAFRASIFREPHIGLMDEALGPGMPSGVGEDTYLFYKILKAGCTFAYEPSAIVWHRHRTSLRSLYRQIYNYSKGHVAYHLTTLYRDGDWRGLFQIAIQLPLWHLARIVRRLRGKYSYSLVLILIEVAGNLAGPWALLRSLWRVKREGRDGFDPANQQDSIVHAQTKHMEAG